MYKGILDKQAPGRDPGSQLLAVLRGTRGLVRTTRLCHWAESSDCFKVCRNLFKAVIKFGGFLLAPWP